MGRDGSGWGIRDIWAARKRESGKRWEARALDPRRGVYTYESFPDKLPDGRNGYQVAEEWAKGTAARLRSGLDSTGTVSLAAVARSYLEQLEEDGRCVEHRREIQRVVDGLVGAGIADLQAKDFPLRAKSHIVRWRDQHKFRRSLVDKDGNLVVFKRGPRKGQVKREGQLLAESTRHRYLGHVKAIAKHAVTWDYLVKNPMDKVSLDAGETSKATFTIDQLRKLVEAPPSGHSEDDWLMVCNLVYGGLRLGEALHLRWEWIDWGSNLINVRKHPAYRLKRNRERRVPLQPEHRAILEPRKRDIGWIIGDELRALVGVPEFYKLRSKKTGKLRANPDSKGAWTRFRAYVAACGVDPGDRSPHSTRHTWVALMLATGEDSSFVQLWAGHRDITTTIAYANARDELRKAVDGWKRGEFRLLSAELRAKLGLVA